MYKDDAASGQIFDATYRLERRLGGDQLANLYVATHMRFDHRVVLKILDRKASEIPDAVERFSAEVLALWRLNHANVVKVYAHGFADDGSFFIVMEYVAGEDLRQLLTREGRLPEVRVRGILSQLFAGLVHAHGYGVVHRDLKPENVMLSPRRGVGELVRLVDFGIALLNDPRVSGGGRKPQGTIGYIAPELLLGGQASFASDLYAASVCGYELLTGRLPFDAPSPLVYGQQLISRDPPKPAERAPGISVSPALEALLLAGMSREPSKRPKKALEFISALEAVTAK